MAFKKGQSGNPEGRKPGTPNKTTKEVREAYQRLTEANLDNMSIWLSQIASEDPAKAMDLMLRLSEYIIPKLARQEMVGNNGEDLFKNVKFQFGPDINSDQDRITE